MDSGFNKTNKGSETVDIFPCMLYISLQQYFIRYNVTVYSRAAMGLCGAGEISISRKKGTGSVHEIIANLILKLVVVQFTKMRKLNPSHSDGVK